MFSQDADTHTRRITDACSRTAVAFILLALLNSCAESPSGTPITADPAAQLSAQTGVVDTGAIDSEPPAAPSFVSISLLKQDQIRFYWPAASDNVALEGYEIYLDGYLVGETEDTSFTLTQLEADTRYELTIKSVDTSLNVSNKAASLSFTTAAMDHSLVKVAATDQTPPTAPADLRVTSIGRDKVTLFWTPSRDETAVAGYRIYQQSVAVRTVQSHHTQIDNLKPETTYLFRVQAFDAAGNLSPLSQAVSATTGGAFVVAALGTDIYATSCAGCHGADGTGVGATIGVTRPLPVAELTTIIEETMPPADPTSCIADCAVNVAQYIFDTFATEQPVVSDPFSGFADAATLRAEACERAVVDNRSDAVIDAFCGAQAPVINNLVELRSALGLTFNNPTATRRRNNGANGNPSFALTGHSSSLVARQVNAINPRAIVFTANRARRGGTAPDGFVATGFVRGDQFVEIIAADRNNNNALNFYLVSFKNPCNASGDCSQGDLLTPAIESNWTDVTLMDEVTLANTVVDCLQCHQPGGPGTQKNLIMQELAAPWSHWFRTNTASRVLLDDFRAAKGRNEDYAGIPANLVSASDPRLLEFLVRRSNSQRRNLFNSRAIEAEVMASSPAQPADNTIPGTSRTWNRINRATLAGTAIAVPYHDIKVTDPAQLPLLIQAYRDWRSGTLATADLPDLRDAFYATGLRDIGLRVAERIDGEGIIRQACTQCHNSLLDQSLTRARFNVDLNAMSDAQGGILTTAQRDAEIGLAINRLKLSAEDVRLMPPPLFRALDAAEIDLATRYLCSQTSAPISQCAGL